MTSQTVIVLLLTTLHLVDSKTLLEWIMHGTAAGIRKQLAPQEVTPPKPVDEFAELASQGAGLVSYFSSLLPSIDGEVKQQPASLSINRLLNQNTFSDQQQQQSNMLGIPFSSSQQQPPNILGIPFSSPQQQQSNLLGIQGVPGIPSIPGLPNIPGLSGIPILPGVVGALPGAGGCYPSGLPGPMQSKSPSIIRDVFGQIPGITDMLQSFSTAAPVRLDMTRLLGTWHWVLITPSVHPRYCGISEYTSLLGPNYTSSFGIFDSFNEATPSGEPRVAFGYGVVLSNEVQVYTENDPCPYHVVAAGNGRSDTQYDYLVLSNWSKYPVIGLARDLKTFNRKKMDAFLRREGYFNALNEAMQTVRYTDWTFCRDSVIDEEKPGSAISPAVGMINAFLHG